MDKEVWKNFIFKSKEYKISNFGNVSSLDGTPIKQRLNKDGYCLVTLGSKHERTSIAVHVLVAREFVYCSEFFNEKLEVNHIDFDRENNHHSNLEWITHQENILHSIKAKRMFYQNNDMNGENNPNYGNRLLSKIYSENLEYAKEKQGRPGLKNGRCVKIQMIGNGLDLEFDYIRQCSKFLFENQFSKSISSESNISVALSENKKYLGFNFYRI